MHHMALDPAAAARTLTELLREGQRQVTHHHAARPTLPSAAAGRDFQRRAEAIQALLGTLHEQHLERLEAIISATQAADAEVRRAAATDAEHAQALGGQP